MRSIDKYLIFDDPIPYKTLMINPVRMRDYINFHECKSCLLLDKNSVPDPEVISMSYFEYLISTGLQDPFFITSLDKLFRLILTTKTINEDGSIYFDKLDKEDDILVTGDSKNFIIRGETFNSDDFDSLKELICLQNQVDLIDESVSKEVREALEKAEETKARNSGTKFCELEDELVAVSAETGFSLDYLFGLTIRKFSKYVARTDNTMHYKIYMGGVMSGNISMKDGKTFNSWLSDLEEEDKYKNSKIGLDELRGKLGDSTIDSDELDKTLEKTKNQRGEK